jgi:hypothetical protein
MLGGMRAFYGCWPWEYSKTWYRTEKEIARLPSVRRPVSADTEEAPTMLIPISESADTEEAPTMPNPLADAPRKKIAESGSGTPPGDDALRAVSENEYPKQSTSRHR